MKKALVSLGLAGLLFFTPAMPTYAQHNPAEQTTLEYKIEKTFPNQSIKDIENFRQYTDDIIKIVAEQMNIKIDERIQKPKIITEKDITQEEFNKRVGYPKDYFKAMWPYYFDKENEIILRLDSKLHNLIHELVHYFQVQYQHADPKQDFNDSLEGQAVRIQRWFEEKYLK